MKLCYFCLVILIDFPVKKLFSIFTKANKTHTKKKSSSDFFPFHSIVKFFFLPFVVFTNLNLR